MAEKTYIRSIRFTEEMADLIDRQTGDSFTAKFEALVTRCVWELPAAEAELERVNQKIRERRQELQQLQEKTVKLGTELRIVENKISELSREIQKSLELMA